MSAVRKRSLQHRPNIKASALSKTPILTSLWWRRRWRQTWGEWTRWQRASETQREDSRRCSRGHRILLAAASWMTPRWRETSYTAGTKPACHAHRPQCVLNIDITMTHRFRFHICYPNRIQHTLDVDPQSMLIPALYGWQIYSFYCMHIFSILFWWKLYAYSCLT